MKFINGSSFSRTVSETATILMSSGIAVSTTDDYANIPKYGTAARNIKSGIWILLDHQYEDALCVIKDKNYVVKNPLSEEEIEFLKSSAKNTITNFINDISSKVITVIVIFIFLFIVVYVFVNAFS